MASTPSKRNKEKDRQERQRDKAAKRAQRRIDRANQPPPTGDGDPDLEGIIPGPQPPLFD